MLVASMSYGRQVDLVGTGVSSSSSSCFVVPRGSGSNSGTVAAHSDASMALWPVLADLLFHVLCFLRASSLGRLLYSSHEAELKVRLLLPALLERRGWGDHDLLSNPLSTLHLSELWDLLADVASPVGVHYMLLRHVFFGTLLELKLSQGTSLAHFGFCVSDEATPMWCRGSFVVRGALQCKSWTNELRRLPRRTPLTQATVSEQSTYSVEHCGDRFVLRPFGTLAESRPQLQLTSRGFIAIAAEGGGVVVEDGQPARRIEAAAPEDPYC